MGFLTDCGLLPYLSNIDVITDLKATELPGLKIEAIQQWERDSLLLLPSDMKEFYVIADGFSLTWCVKFNNAKLPLGKMNLNSLKSVQKLEFATSNKCESPSFADLNDDEAETVESGSSGSPDETSQANAERVPVFGNKNCQIFELEHCGNNERVCLVNFRHPSNTYSIWFLDRSFRWHFLAQSFTDYVRLMLVHLGLPKWQYLSTQEGLPSNLKLWYAYFVPSRLQFHEFMFNQTINSQSQNEPTVHEHVVGFNFAELLGNSAKNDPKKAAKPPAADPAAAKVKAVKSAKT